jgi:hypothetical protein
MAAFHELGSLETDVSIDALCAALMDMEAREWELMEVMYENFYLPQTEDSKKETTVVAATGVLPQEGAALHQELPRGATHVGEEAHPEETDVKVQQAPRLAPLPLRHAVLPAPVPCGDLGAGPADDDCARKRKDSNGGSCSSTLILDALKVTKKHKTDLKEKWASCVAT